jgi:hypothetical protein
MPSVVIMTGKENPESGDSDQSGYNQDIGNAFRA